MKGPQDKNMRTTIRNTMRASKYPQNMRKTMGNNLRETNAMLGKNKTFKEKEEVPENDNIEEDDFEEKPVKKRLRIRLTDEEYRLLLKLKAKKKSAQQQQ